MDPEQITTPPPGAMPNEVADDKEVRLSEGEYVIPADVVRFLGLDKIESLVSKAKQSLEKMAQGGMEAGSLSAEEDVELPFSLEELASEDSPEQVAPQSDGEAPGMASGGLVTGQMFSPLPTPEWLVNTPTAKQYEEQTQGKSPRDSDDSTFSAPTGLAGRVQDWSVQDFDRLSRSRNDVGRQVIEGGLGTLPGMGKLLDARYDHINDTVPKQIESMLGSGKDLKGNTLTEEDKATLSRVKEEYDTLGGLNPGSNPTKTLTNKVLEDTGIKSALKPLTDVVDSITKPVKDVKAAVTKPMEDLREEVKGRAKTASKGLLTSLKEMVTGNPEVAKSKKVEEDVTPKSKGLASPKSNNSSKKSGEGKSTSEFKGSYGSKGRSMDDKDFASDSRARSAPNSRSKSEESKSKK